MHPVNWDNANATPPPDDEQREYLQFRINKSKGRIIGFQIEGIFYIVWLDPHHNLTDSEGYGKATYHRPAMNLYEDQEKCIRKLKKENQELTDLINNS